MGTAAYGWAILLSSALYFVAGLYALFLSKLLPTTSNPILAAIAKDRHYCLAIIGMLPVTFVFVLANWFALKYFRHN